MMPLAVCVKSLVSLDLERGGGKRTRTVEYLFGPVSPYAKRPCIPVTYMWYSAESFMPGLLSNRFCVEPVAVRSAEAIDECAEVPKYLCFGNQELIR